jgi:hypothetical protein
MVMEPKTWSKNEIVALIAETGRKMIAEERARGKVWKMSDLADEIYTKLDEEGLIEHTP